MDYCKYVNVFHGCEETDCVSPGGIAAKWFFIKALCGNTSPAATLPFGGMSVGPYSGGYASGYTDHLVNTHAKTRRFPGGDGLLGFSHLQQSGTGYIDFFYNYAVTTPRYASSERRRKPENEEAEPGYYACSLEDIKCEMTADNRTAYHRFTFGRDGGEVVIDFSLCGLHFDDEEADKKHGETVTDISLKVINSSTVAASFTAQGIKHYWAVKGTGKAACDGSKVIFRDFGKKAEIKVALSLRSEEKALDFIENSADFNSARKSAYDKWNETLSKIKIETKDERIKRIFYSNLYHSSVKPCDRTGENFIDGRDGDFMVDFATLWDMYKTQLPLIFMTDREISEKITGTLLDLCDTLGHIPNSLGISDRYNIPSGQARTLGCYALMTAYRYGIKTDPHRMVRAIEKDIFAPNKRDFTVEGRCRSATWTLDMAECCRLCAGIAEETGEKEISGRLRSHADKWKSCFDTGTGLLTENSDYYEGTLYNYSFRQMADMDSRIALSGGKENFVKLLDKFFGYGQPDRKMPIDPEDTEYIETTMKNGIFEGFNNESDTEAPFSYIYAGRQDRTCEIVRSGMKNMFTEGRGGLPGNNDSGALSSYYVFMALGLFPVAGQDLFLIGSPFIDRGEVALSGGNRLTILVDGNSEENIYVEKVDFNGKEIKDFRITAGELMKGGILHFKMTGVKKNV